MLLLSTLYVPTNSGDESYLIMLKKTISILPPRCRSALVIETPAKSRAKIKDKNNRSPRNLLCQVNGPIGHAMGSGEKQTAETQDGRVRGDFIFS